MSEKVPIEIPVFASLQFEVKNIDSRGYLYSEQIAEALNDGWEPIGGPFVNGNYTTLTVRRRRVGAKVHKEIR